MQRYEYYQQHNSEWVRVPMPRATTPDQAAEMLQMYARGLLRTRPPEWLRPDQCQLFQVQITPVESQ
jgi:hypothetical protein